MNRVLIITSIVTAAAVVFYTIFAYLQWRAIKKQGDYALQQVGKMQAQFHRANKLTNLKQEQRLELRAPG